MNLLNAPREENFDSDEIFETSPVKKYLWSLKDILIVFGLIFIVGLEIGYGLHQWVNKDTIASNFFLAVQGVVTMFLIWQATRSFKFKSSTAILPE